MKEYDGFKGISAVTRDNTSPCVNDRRTIAEKYPGVNDVNDQAHV